MAKPVCAVVGVGPGNGKAFAKRFAKEGYQVALLSRSTDYSEKLAAELEDAKAYACDVTDAVAIERAFAQIRDDLGDVDVLLYNAGSGTFGPFDQVSDAQFEASWRINTLGLLQSARAVIGPMRERGTGSILITGATASLRGKPFTTAFASAKAAQRSLAQSLARTLWPDGIHVALVIVDGVIDLPRSREGSDKPDDFYIKPADIAHIMFHLAGQPKSAWSFEVEARPFGENW
ncbi:MAG: SDR family NAD(P)-dependent oxidoreductase [Myxococcota bacterium]